jgi:hypothetical protein
LTLSAAAWASAKVRPVSTVMVKPCASTARTVLRRPTDSTISPFMAIWPPTRPVLPAWGTTGILCAVASAMICETSSVEPGRSTMQARPSYMSRHSRR